MLPGLKCALAEARRKLNVVLKLKVYGAMLRPDGDVKGVEDAVYERRNRNHDADDGEKDDEAKRPHSKYVNVYQRSITNGGNGARGRLIDTVGQALKQGSVILLAPWRKLHLVHGHVI